MKKKYTYQIVIAVILVCFGVILLIIAFIVPPTGVIDPTVLTAYGETLTFAGSLIGIDYHYVIRRDGSIEELHRSYPRALIVGHNTFSAKACPCYRPEIEYADLQPK